MPAIHDRDKLEALRVAELGDVIYKVQPENTPFIRLLPRGPAPEQMLATWPIEGNPRAGFDGTPDGFDIQEFNSTNRDKMESYGMWMMTDGWMATRLANLTSTAGVARKKEEARQRARDALKLALMGEAQVLSDMDAQKEVPSENKVYRSRGAFSWMSATEQSVLPVPAAYRPPSASVYTGALASRESTGFEDMLQASALLVEDRLDLMGFVGLRLKRQMSLWASRVVGVQSGEQFLDARNMSQSDKKLVRVIDFFEFEAGTVKTALSYNLLRDATTGAVTDYSSRSGLFLNLKKWELRFLDPPAGYKMPHGSGGGRGYHDQVHMLCCKLPLGQVVVKTNT